MAAQRPLRPARPQTSHRPPSPPPYARRHPGSPLIDRGGHRRRRRQHSRRLFGALTALLVVLSGYLLCRFVFFKQALPVTAPDVSQRTDSSSALPSDPVSDPINPAPSGTDEAYDRAYAIAKTVLLVNFDHPNYAEPTDLVSVTGMLPACVTVNSGATKVTQETAQALSELFRAAEADGITTFILNSAYRDRATQQSFWDNRLKKDPTYGDDVYANPVKTVPATASEHCTGLAVDILCDSVPHGTSDYKDTREAKWLAEHAYQYGFILRYPDDKQSMTGVMFEPWHYRYVGKEAAAAIFESGLCLEEYLALYDLA